MKRRSEQRQDDQDIAERIPGGVHVDRGVTPRSSDFSRAASHADKQRDDQKRRHNQ
jgi:hypothetical protein